MIFLDSSRTLLPKVAGQAETVPKVEMGGWKSVKVKQHTFTQAASLREQKRTRVSSDQQVVLSVHVFLVFPVLLSKHRFLVGMWFMLALPG